MSLLAGELAGAPLLAGAELVAAVPEVPEVPDVTGPLVPCDAVLLAPWSGEAFGDAEELVPEEDGLAEDVVDFGAAVGLAAAFGLLLVQFPWVSELVVALAADADVVAFGLLLVLVLVLVLALGLPLGLAGVVSLSVAEPDDEPDVAGVGLTEAEAEADGEVLAGLDELAAGEGEADACGHDEIGVGARCFAAVVRAPVAPPWPLPSACPPPPAAGALAALADGWLLSTPDTDEATAWRSGGTEASTTPTTNTAHATAMAGLSTVIRQSRGRCCRWPRPEESPPRAAYQRRTVSARKPERAGAAGRAWLLA